MYRPAMGIAENVSYRVGASLHVQVSTTCFILHAAFFILHVHVFTYDNLLASQDVFIAHVHNAVGSLPLANNAIHSPSTTT